LFQLEKILQTPPTQKETQTSWRRGCLSSPRKNNWEELAKASRKEPTQLQELVLIYSSSLPDFLEMTLSRSLMGKWVGKGQMIKETRWEMNSTLKMMKT